MKHLQTALYTPYFLETAKLNSALIPQTSSISICRSTHVNDIDNSRRSKNALAFDNQLRTSFTYGACGTTCTGLHVLACARCRGRLVYMTTFTMETQALTPLPWPPPRLFITGFILLIDSPGRNVRGQALEERVCGMIYICCLSHI